MAYLKSFMTLFTGVGIGVPSAVAIKQVTTSKFPSELKRFTSAVQLEWTGKDMQEEIGKLINGFGKLIHKEDNDGKKADVLGIRLNTWSAFDKNVCEKIGFNQNNKTSNIVCHQD